MSREGTRIARARCSEAQIEGHDLQDLDKEAAVTLSVITHPINRTYSTASDSQSMANKGSQASYATMNLPFDAHVTPATGKRVNCEFPVVFAAHSKEMHGLMTSIVCQRAVMGISTPVVGISLSEEDTVASAVFGWTDDVQPVGLF